VLRHFAGRDGVYVHLGDLSEWLGGAGLRALDGGDPFAARALAQGALALLGPDVDASQIGPALADLVLAVAERGPE
jgi:hypothetical protein